MPSQTSGHRGSTCGSRMCCRLAMRRSIIRQSMGIAVALLIASASAAAPQTSPTIAVVVSRRSATTPAKALYLAQRVSEILSGEGLTLAADAGLAQEVLASHRIQDSAECKGKRSCLSRLGKLLSASVIVGIETASIEDTVGVHIEAVSTADDNLLTVHDFVTTGSTTSEAFKRDVLNFVNKLRPKLGKSSTAPSPGVAQVEQSTASPSDVPRAPTPEPDLRNTPSPTTDAAIVTHAPAAPARVGAWATGGGAVGALAVAGVLTVVASGQKGQLDSSKNGNQFDLTQAKAQGLASAANTNYTAALVLLLGGALLAGTSAYLFLRGSDPGNEP
jgi:hypothetical protein